ncbi:MAG TPA: archaemetzincin [Planctomycetota bacterium]|nr:archaemetzincin [Planctomycetota bacterium]
MARMRTLALAGLIMTASCPKPPEPGAEAEAGAERLGPPQPGEWRHAFPEEPQSFDAYVAACANRRTAERSVFYLQPLGAAGGRHKATIERLRRYAEAFFGVPARVCPTIPMFENGWVPQRGQFNSTMGIGQLAESVPPDALVYAGITDQDLFARGLHFVFGEGSLKNRCGLYSLARLETDDEGLFLRRAVKLMSHEAGHILSIEHCTTYRCLMQGSNSLQESDRHPLSLCPLDLRKLRWNTNFDAKERADRLFTFYQETGMAP